MWTGAEPGAQPSYPRPGSVAGRLKWATPICPARLLMTAFRTEPKVRQRTYVHTLLFTSHSALSNHPKEKCQINHLRRVSQSGFCLLTTVQTRYKPGLVSCRPLIGLIHIHSFVHPPCDTYFPKPASLYCRAVKQTNYHPTITYHNYHLLHFGVLTYSWENMNTPHRKTRDCSRTNHPSTVAHKLLTYK